jgi:cytochrome c-type biogenesis protein CcmF
VLEALDAGKVSVGAPYYNLTFVPIMMPLFIVMGIGPMLSWKRADLSGVLARLRIAAVVAGLIGCATILLYDGPVMAIVGVGLAAWLIMGAVTELCERIKLFRAPFTESIRRLGGVPRSAIGMTLAHASMGVIVLGISASSAWQSERILVMAPGDTVAIAGYDVRLARVDKVKGPNYLAVRAELVVTDKGKPVTILTPEKRTFSTPPQTTTEAAIYTTFMADLYGVLGDPVSPGAGSSGRGGAKFGWTIRLYHNPLVPWIWIGAVIMVLGGLVSLTDRRHRVGAPGRKRQPVPGPA